MEAAVTIVGAGMAGLACARRILEQAPGTVVSVIDRGIDVGGRLRTVERDGATFDAGAQFFTVRSSEFAAAVSRWEAGGLVSVWCHGFTPGGDGFPRYRATGGMQELARRLAAEIEVLGASITCGTTVRNVRPMPAAMSGARWSVDGAGTDAVVLTAPLPLATGLVHPTLTADVADIGWEPTICLLAMLFDDAHIPEPGAVQLHDPDAVLSFVADNRLKGISAMPALTLHASAAWSAEHIAHPDDVITALLLEAAAPWIGDQPVVTTELHRWLHARPTGSAGEGALALAPGLVLAGDAFCGGKVEGAWRSGVAAADLVSGSLA